MLSAYAVLCSAPNYRCYATHQYNPYFSVNGLETVNKVLYTTGTAGWIASQNWVFLVDGNFIEMGWQDDVTNTAKPFLNYGQNGGAIQTWNCNTTPQFCPADNSSITTRIDDMDKNKVWTFTAAGITATRTMATEWTNEIETGYELTHNTEINVRKNDYNSLKYGRDILGWILWNSSDGTHAKTVTGGFFVKYCGGATEQFYHSQHGKGTQPPSCT